MASLNSVLPDLLILVEIFLGPVETEDKKKATASLFRAIPFEILGGGRLETEKIKCEVVVCERKMIVYFIRYQHSMCLEGNQFFEVFPILIF